MTKTEQLYEGKAKKVWATEDPDVVIVDYKDDATAFNGVKKGTIVGKGVVNNKMSNYLMQILEKAGIAIPNRCRSGECGWCHSLLKSGQVWVPQKLDYRRKADLKFNFIHPCCTFALSDIELDIPPAK